MDFDFYSAVEEYFYEEYGMRYDDRPVDHDVIAKWWERRKAKRDKDLQSRADKFRKRMEESGEDYPIIF